MLLHNDVVTDGEPKPGAFSRRLRCEERIEHLFLYVRKNTSTIVPDRYFDPVTEVLGAGSENGFVIVPTRPGFALGRRIEAICNQVQKNTRDVLREDISLARRRIERFLQCNIEALFLCSRPVPSEIEAFLDQGIDVDRSVFARAFTRVQQ